MSADYDAILLAELERDEGFRSKVYRCTAGKLSVGIGRNLDDRGISLDEARYMARNDIANGKVELDRNAPWWRELDPVRQRVLENMCFQLGWPKLAGFRRFLAAAKARQWEAASREMLDSKWAKVDCPARAQRLAQMIRTGRA